MGSVAQRKAKPVSGLIYLSQGFFNGRPTWHYLLVDKMKLPILLKAVQAGEVDLPRFGHIVFSGFGEKPPEDVSNFVKKKYGSNSN